MSDLFHVKPEFAAAARVNAEGLRLMTNHAAREPEAFWLEQARRLAWDRFPTRAGDAHFGGEGRPPHVRWFADGALNACVNCLDRHLPIRRDQVAFHWEGDGEDARRVLTYGELHEEVCRLANALRGLGVRRGDRVAIHMPPIPEAVAAMLACARIGAPHCVVFAGFSAENLSRRVEDIGARALIAADRTFRAGRAIDLAAGAAEAAAACPALEHLIVLRRSEAPLPSGALDYRTLVDAQPAVCEPESMAATDPLFILHTSGSTGAPKGVVHGTGGYLLWSAFTFELAFDHKPGDVHWCTADIGWITGHSYGVYGPLACGATCLLHEGAPTHPDAGRVWRMVDRYGVSLFYTAPTLLRGLMREGDAPVRAASRASLRVLGSVGEPIDPVTWRWFQHVAGEGRRPVVDSWWQTETGGIMIAPVAGAVAQKPGSAALPLPGVLPVLVDEAGGIVEGEGEGRLCLGGSWPGQMQGLWNAPERFAAYFEPIPGLLFTGDGARRDADGYWWITGRVDDVINVAGHRLSAAELEGALASHEAVAECAVVGAPHALKGQAPHAFAVLRSGRADGEALRAEIASQPRRRLGPIAALESLRVVAALPKTRSGKVIRRILRQVAAGEADHLGDVSTLADPEAVAALRRD